MSKHSPEILSQLRSNDFAVEVMEDVERQSWGLYKHPNGKIVRLPCDGRTQKLLLRDGFIFLGKEER